MIAEKHYPDEIKGSELDAYLAKGWYRMGQSVFTTHFLNFGKDFYSAIWIRQPLTAYHFSKSLRKILRRNKEQFTIKIEPYQLTDEKEILYQEYKQSFDGVIASTLRESLQDNHDFNIFESYETLVYDGEELIAFSIFDLGSNSSTSILGVYDTNYNKYSLGLFTMLLEIEFSIQNGLDYFYPGYFVPGNSRFDYKLRIGEVEYYDLYSKKWYNINRLEEGNIPLTKMLDKMNRLKASLVQKGMRPSPIMYQYPLFEANLFGYWNAPYFEWPLILMCGENNITRAFLIAVFDPTTDAFKIIECSRFDDIKFYFNSSFLAEVSHESFFMELLITKKTLAESSETDQMAHYIIEILKEGSYQLPLWESED